LDQCRSGAYAPGSRDYLRHMWNPVFKIREFGPVLEPVAQRMGSKAGAGKQILDA